MGFGNGLIRGENIAVSVPIAIGAILVSIYLLVNGQSLFQSNFNTGEANRQIIEIYLLMDVAVLFLVPFQRSSFIRLKAPDLLYWVPAFVLTGLMVSNVYHPLIPINSANYEVLMLLFQIFVVSFSETWIFLGAVQSWLMQRGIKSAFIWQAILFGMFHYAAYHGSVIALARAISFGVIVGLIYTAFYRAKLGDKGLAVAWGIHAGWNVSLLTTVFLLGML